MTDTCGIKAMGLGHDEPGAIPLRSATTAHVHIQPGVLKLLIQRPAGAVDRPAGLPRNQSSRSSPVTIRWRGALIVVVNTIQSLFCVIMSKNHCNTP
jgi:hypothetical protein